MSKFQQPRPLGLVVASALTGIEGLVLGALGVQLALSLILGTARNLLTSVALFALVAGAATWLVFVALSLWRGRRWARSAGVFWQLVQLAIATGSFSGQFGSQAIGWGLIIPSLVVLFLLLSKKVVAATMGSADTDDEHTDDDPGAAN